MREVIATAKALGLGVEESLAKKQIARTRSMGAYKASTLLDFQHGLPLELEGLFFEPLRAAQRIGVPAPHLSALCRVLTEPNKNRRGQATRCGNLSVRSLPSPQIAP